MKHLTLLLLLIVQLFANIPTCDKVGNIVTKSVEGLETSYTLLAPMMSVGVVYLHFSFD
jgi:hypothetical protein